MGIRVPDVVSRTSMNTQEAWGTRSAAIRRMLDQRSGHVHLVGICGIGMAGLAVLLKHRGFHVSGCDHSLNRLAAWLRDRGVTVVQGHAAAHITPDVTWVIRSAAVKPDAEEPTTALANGLPVFKRGEVLPLLLAGTTSVAVSGTHGKTTTTTFIAELLTAGGREPSFCIGGEVEVLGGPAACGNGQPLVVEADESDGTLALYAPDFAVITNIEFDHMEHFAGIEAFEDCFRCLIRNTRRRIIFCADDPIASRLCADARNTTSYGVTARADIRAGDIEEQATALRFTLIRDGRPLGVVDLPVPGRHNVLNALAAAAIGFEMGLSFEDLQRGLSKVSLPRRRFERFVDRPDVVVLSDYAHHPSEIAACIAAARRLQRRRLLAVFQPHRFTRTRALGPDFPASFRGVDEVILVPVYAASEMPLMGGSTWDLYTHFRRQSASHVRVAPSLRTAWEYCRGQLQSGDALLVIGAGDVERIAEWARDDLRDQPLETIAPAADLAEAVRGLDVTDTSMRLKEPLAPKTSLGVGGTADLWLDIGSASDLAAVLRWIRRASVPFHVLGAGSNVLISDLGLRGITARLTGTDFSAVEARDDILVAGAAVPLARLTACAEECGRTGLEFLSGIPGSVGGALCGNAGAWGHAIGERVAWVRCLDAEGQTRTLHANDLTFLYRGCPALAGQIVLQAGFTLPRAERAAIRQQMDDYLGRRTWLKGQRSAGSIFKNPPGDYAGRLIEATGLKGYAIGGARVWERHANVFVCTEDACASDVQTLMAKTREEVRLKFAVELEPEIVSIG
jgi:UDP-N-acetylmuramate--alanine ligase